MNKCVGCGIELQDKSKKLDGYVVNLENKLCQRCFNIKNYNKLEISNKSNMEFLETIKNIGKTNDLVVLVIDSLDINSKIDEITNYLKNYIVVFTKKDLLPKYVFEEKILNYKNFNSLDKILVSSNKNYNLDELYEMINKYKISNKVYFVGMTNSGKSTLINKLIYNYGNNDSIITTSIVPSTTLNTIEIKLNDGLTLFDTPGLLDDNSILNKIDLKQLKKIVPNKQLKPTTLQIKKDTTILLSDLVVIHVKKGNSLTFYVSNDIDIKRLYKEYKTDLKKQIIEVSNNEDVVINGLGFIKVRSKCQLEIFTFEDVKIDTRKAII